MCCESPVFEECFRIALQVQSWNLFSRTLRIPQMGVVAHGVSRSSKTMRSFFCCIYFLTQVSGPGCTGGGPRRVLGTLRMLRVSCLNVWTSRKAFSVLIGGSCFLLFDCLLMMSEISWMVYRRMFEDWVPCVDKEAGMLTPAMFASLTVHRWHAFEIPIYLVAISSLDELLPWPGNGSLCWRNVWPAKSTSVLLRSGLAIAYKLNLWEDW